LEQKDDFIGDQAIMVRLDRGIHGLKGEL